MSIAAHRVLWTVIGMVLTVLAGAGAAASFGAVPGADPGTSVLWPALLDWWRGLGRWGPMLAIGIGLLLALLGAGLLRWQLRPHTDPAADDLTVYQGGDGRGSRPGRTVVRAGVLADGLARDLERDGRVREADVELHGRAPEPELDIQLRLVAGVSPRAVQDHVRTTVDRFRRTSGFRPSRIDVSVKLDASAPTRVG